MMSHKRYKLILTVAIVLMIVSVAVLCLIPYSAFNINNTSVNYKILLGNVGNTKVAVFISTSHPESISGHSFIINGSDNDTIAFKLKNNGSKIIFEQNGRSKTIKIIKLTENDREISGLIVSGLFFIKKFCFKPYIMPKFEVHNSPRYRYPIFDVDTITDVKYGSSEGYWTEMDYDYDYYDILKGLGRTLSQQKLSLLMDIYLPKDFTCKKHPLVMLMHGGAFYVGCKDDIPMQKWCSHYASMGYVAVSINYRMGFIPTKRSIERAGYAAIQDAHAAMRFLVENQSVYGIDTSMMFVGGTSAGAITALHLAFMTNNTRPEASYEYGDMGDIDGSGNNIHKTFTIKGVVDMWGAVYDINMLDSKNIPVLAFHGDKDDVVPYSYDYPFTDINLGPMREKLFNKLYGSSETIKRLSQNGVKKSKMYTLDNMSHSPHIDSGGDINNVFFYIQDRMDVFFRDITTGVDIVAHDNTYCINDIYATNVTWRADGGIILKNSGNSISVAWFGNAPKRAVYASGMIRGTGFVNEFDINNIKITN